MRNLSIDEISLKAPSREMIDALTRVKAAVWSELAPNDPPMSGRAALSDLQNTPVNAIVRHLVARVGDEVAGLGSLHHQPSGANVGVATVTIEVHPRCRRVGVGQTLLRELVSIARSSGSDSLVSWSPRTPATQQFWEMFGFPEVQRTSRNRVSVAAIDLQLMARWRQAANARQLGYTLHSFEGRCPADLLLHFIATQNGMQDAPTDELDLAFDPIDEAQLRAYESALAARGGTAHVLIAVDPAGNAAGLTEVVAFDHTPHIVFQQTTATLPAHRGSGLGRWLKAEMCQHIIDHLSHAAIIETGNADSNTSMLTINHQMGFEPFLSYSIGQGPLEQVWRRLDGVKAGS